MKASVFSFGLVSLLTTSLLIVGGCDNGDDDGSDGAEGADGVDGAEEAGSDGGTGTDDGGGEGSGDSAADDGAGDGCEGGSGGEDCPAQAECIQSNCESQYTACYGEDFENGNPGGACEGYLTCVIDCDCDVGCIQECELSKECITCFYSLNSCVTENCADVECS